MSEDNKHMSNWHIARTCLVIPLNGTDYRLNVPIIVGGDGRPVCTVEVRAILDENSQPKGFDTSECDSVARLVVAAPRMRRLLESLYPLARTLIDDKTASEIGEIIKSMDGGESC